MLQRILFTVFLLLANVLLSLASDLPNSRTSSYYKYVYKLNAQEAKAIYKKGLAEVDESYFHSKVDSIPNDSVFNTKLSLGNYLLVSAYKNELKFELRSYADIDVMVHNNYADLLLTISDQEGLPVANAKVSINGVPVRYKPNLHAYHNTRMNKTGWLEVIYNGFTSYHYLGNAIKKGTRFKKVVYSFPIKYVYIPARLLVCLPYDVVRTVIKGRPQGLLYYTYAPFRDTYLSIFRPGMYGWLNNLVRRSENTWSDIMFKDFGGYMVFSQPKYKPNDTVRFKSFVTRPNGSPIAKQALKGFLTGDGKTIALGEILPNRNGAYDYEFALHDSLNLKLDKTYTIQLRKNGWNTIISRSFKYEDYELNTINYKMRVDDTNHLRGKPMFVYLKGEDMNGLSVPDGRVRLTVLSKKSYRKIYAPSAFLPDTLYAHQQNLNPVGETIIELPDSIFPPLEFSYQIKVAFLTSDNELVEKEKNVRYYFEKEEITMDVLNDSLHFVYKVLDKEVAIKAELQCFDKNGNILLQHHIELPFSTPVNYKASSYRVLTSAIKKSFDMKRFLPGLQVSSKRTNNQVAIKINNPAGIGFNYFIYKRNKEIAHGYAQQLDTIVRMGNVKGCFVSLNYQWGGKPYEKALEIPLYRKQLNVTMEQPGVIYPGQKTDITVAVTDYKNRPVRGVDLTAYGLTKKFAYAPPTLHYSGKSHKTRTMFNNYDMLGDKNFGLSAQRVLDYGKWQPIMRLDTITYYQFTRPQEGVCIEHLPVEGMVTQFAPYVYKDGEIQQVHFMFMDYKLLYSSVSTSSDPYSFECKTGYHKIRLRTSDQDITIDSVFIKHGEKTLLSVDATKANGQIKTSQVDGNLSSNEKRLIQTKFAKFNTSANYGFIYLEQHGNKHVIKSEPSYPNKHHSFYGRLVIAGPFKPGAVSFVCKYGYRTSFDFEASYEYYISPNMVKMKTNDSFWSYPTLTNNGKTPKFTDRVLTQQKIDEIGNGFGIKRTQSSIQYNNPYTTTKGNGGIGLVYKRAEVLSEAKVFLQNISVFKDDNPLFMRIYPANAKRIYDLEPGSYRLFFVMRDGAYFERKKVEVSGCGINIISIQEPDVVLKDESSDVIAKLIKDKWTVSSNAANESINKWKAEQEIKKVYHKSQLDYTDGRTITGCVVGSDGLPIPGATVMLRGTDVGAMTDIEGNYTLEVPMGTWEITYSFIGYEALNIPLSYSDEINVELEESELALDEVMAVGYGVQRSQNMTGSIASVPSEALQGYMAGICVESSGATAMHGDMLIRGVNSSQENSRPLIIVDGVAVDASYDDIDPSLISSMQVLKDQASTAIYGARGANGVIIISTKEGSGIAGLTQINDYEVPFQVASKNSIRSNFSDMAYWQPNLVTNANGEASFTTTFPDDITSWKTYALAMGPRKTTGQVQAEVKSFKPVSAQLMVPRFLTEGDSVNLIGKSLNYTEDTIQVETSYQVDSTVVRKWNRKIARVKVDTLPVVVTTTDTLSLIYSLNRANGYFDGEKRKIPVVAKGVEEVIGDFVTLNTDTLLAIQMPDSCIGGMLYLESDPINILLKESAKLRNYQHLCNEQASSKLLTLLNEERICTYLGKAFKHSDDVNKLIKRLEKSINDEGVWGWWSGLETSYWISTHVIKTLERAREKGYAVSYEQEQAKYALINDYAHCNSWQKLDVLEALLKIETGVAVKEMAQSLNDSVFNRMDSLKFAIIKQQLDMPVDVMPFIKNKHETLYGSYYWGEESWSLFHGQLQETLLMYRLLKNEGNYTDWLPKIRNFFFEKRKNSGWRNTYESALIMEYMLPELLAKNSKGNAGKVLIHQGSKIMEVKEYPYALNINNKRELKIEKTGNQVVFAGWNSRYFNAEPKAKADYFTLETHFEKENEELDFLVAGEKVDLVVDIKVDKKSDYLMLEIPIPSVCSYHIKPNARYGEAHREYFKDKVCIYYSSLAKGEYRVNIKLVPRYTGKVVLNPTRMEHMYFPVFYGNNELKQVIVNQ